MSITVFEARRRWRRVRQEYVSIIADALEERNESAVNLNREQMFEGITSKDKAIRPAYTGLTKLAKRSKGQPADRVTLRDTGEFYSKMYLRISGTKYSILSTDSKTDDLIKKYTQDIFGLTSESKRILWREDLRPLVLRSIAYITGAKIG